MKVTPLLALVFSCAHVPQDTRPETGLIGIHYKGIPEGMLVTDVLPGSGADRAGLREGDLIVAVNGQALGASDVLPGRAPLAGPTGGSVELTVRGPLGAEARTLTVTRLPLAPAREGDEPGDEIEDLRRALASGSTAKATAAASALVAADFDGRRPGAAAARALRAEGRAKPAASVAAARTLAEARPDDLDLQFLAAEALFRAGAYEEAVERLRRLEASRPADVAGEGGWRGDAGGDPWGRSMLARALHALGRSEEARDVALDLARTQDAGDLLDELHLPPPRPGEPWRAALGPVPDFTVTLLDGTSWSLAEHRGQPVLIDFWASWCGPCMAELPHLQELWTAQRASGLSVLAVSVDDPADREAVDRTVKKLGLDMPIAHAPELATRFEVGPIPAVRLLGKEGALRLSDHGYSGSAMDRLAEQVQRALVDDAGAQTVIGDAWSAGTAKLARFLPIHGTGDINIYDSGALVGVADELPLRVEAGANGWAPSLPQPVPPDLTSAGRVAWLEGPLVAAPDEPWVRAWTPDGDPRWMVTTPGPVHDLAVLDDVIYVATEAEILTLDRDGRLLRRAPGGADDLATGPGGLWAVDGEQRRWITAAGAEDRGPAKDGACAMSDGAVGSLLVASCVSGRFGADGGARAVVAREDGAIIGLDSKGSPAFVLNLQSPARLAAWDPDGDERDALLVAIRGQGLAWVELSLP